MINIEWNQNELLLCPEKAVYWPSEKMAFVADTHFGKAVSFWKVGIPVPGNNTGEDCNRLGELVKKLGAKSLVILGDFLHAKVSKSKPVRDSLFQWRMNFPELKLHLVRGNHDLHAGDPWPELKFECHSDPWMLGLFDCRHLPVGSACRPYLAGHIHPSYHLSGKQDSISSPCFVVSPDKIILPAFGSFTGTMNTTKSDNERIFVTDGKEVIEV